MADIKLLDKKVWGQIAAGEVVEKPASIVKELVENSIDAKAKNITIEIKEGGTKLICITDDGCGIKNDQIELAFLPHATSKLRTIDDLSNLTSMGFRGEALASISAVSQIELTTKTDEDEIGHKIILEGGEKLAFQEIACNVGTQIKVSNLFFNTPARAKFLRKNKTEENDITSYVEKLMLSNSDISFKYIVDDKIIYNTKNCNILDTIYTIYGSEVSSNMIEVDYKQGDYQVKGYISKPTLCKSNRTYQSLFVNNRFCINSTISASISNAYETFLMKGKFPIYVLFLNLPNDSVDVNVHPNKLEVKFENSQKIFMLFNNAVYDALSRQTHIKEAVSEISFQSVEPNNFNKVKPNEGISFSEEKSIDNLINKPSNHIHKTEDYKKINEYFVFEQTLQKPIEKEIFTQDKPLQEEIIPKNVDEKEELIKYENLFKATRTIIGVAFNTYIIVQEENNLYFIDQHAAHERQLFDKFMQEIENQDIKVQNLLIPYVFNVNDKEAEFIDQNLFLIRSYGFDISNFGKNCYRVSSIPMLLNSINLKTYFDEILSNLNGYAKKPQEVIRNDIATMACKAAVKGGNKLSIDEINILLDKLKENNNTLLCPHGRPIVIVFDKVQIEKMFKRIV